jgi:hypothetical protein
MGENPVPARFGVAGARHCGGRVCPYAWRGSSDPGRGTPCARFTLGPPCGRRLTTPLQPSVHRASAGANGRVRLLSLLPLDFLPRGPAATRTPLPAKHLRQQEARNRGGRGLDGSCRIGALLDVVQERHVDGLADRAERRLELIRLRGQLDDGLRDIDLLDVRLEALEVRVRREGAR